jgi:hypothetical protein
LGRRTLIKNHFKEEAIIMDREIKRRSFLKHLFSLSAFIAGSSLSFNKNKGCKIGKISQTTALSMDSTGKRMKKIACEEHANKQTLKILIKDLRPWTRPVSICR